MKQNKKQEEVPKLPDFNNRSVLIRFCERQSKATKQTLEENSRLQAESMARARKFQIKPRY